ncbi:coagulation factor IX-like [Megachile rotundata]|uniref:coagulation factor IX-like n=1 Tax=Megachile rotundata TaxID=143995 RepID=UPI000614BD18|nr:PREDICTED: coagulation factor IX-like isoform X1 [Megachile rotundata]XP_012149749.1 PREDICTED: coagulation factor IX-like isoform X2 [Megachile rotundata]
MKNVITAIVIITFSTSVLSSGGRYRGTPYFDNNDRDPGCGASPPMQILSRIVNGDQPNTNEFPWHASLYKQNTLNGTKEFRCGATIIHKKFLVTAAHCVAGDNNSSKYYVATGNIFRDYDLSLHDPTIVKKAEVKNIYIACNYTGYEGNFFRDIAVLEIMEPFVFSNTLVPICLDVTTHMLQLKVGDYGKVAGFGRTSTETRSSTLQSIQVPYRPISDCRSEGIKYQTTRFITSDKFCAGYTNGTSICDGDSGGGLVFKRNGVWYLGGIVSVSLHATLQNGVIVCDSNTLSLYTNVSQYMSWIQDIIHKTETHKPIPTC